MVEYVCRFCQSSLGKLNDSVYSEAELGLDQLTTEEREDIIIHDTNGQMQVRVVCENCERILNHYPERSLLPSLYH
ncbi:anti-sigma-F factor Fin [Shimazuella kribbensis]|uniref:anti-sigma-F factor Fin n=1 Tax=Shimazuella kribbensis TaxID=139808 RepID=UPI00040326E1|nr:anti-sigma-F factor Fin [Shimazuella kribbensis]